MLRAETLRDGARIRRLVEAGFPKAKIEGLQRSRTRLRHVSDHEARVDAAGEKAPQGHIGDELRTHAGGDRGIDALEHLLPVEGNLVRSGYLPIAPGLELSVARAPRQLRGGRELPDGAQKRTRGQACLASQVIAERLVIDPARESFSR